MKELIERLNRRYVMSMFATPAMLYDTLNEERKEAADALEQQAKQIEELAAALADKQEALEEVQGLIDESQGVYGLHLNGDLSPWDELLSGGRFERLGSLDHARALQPHAALVAKIKADAVREAAQSITIDAYRIGVIAELNHYADRIEREGK